MSLEADQMLSHYRLVEKIGEGGMDVAWNADDTVLNRNVAIKILPSSLAETPERLAQFQQEARAVSALNHPNLVTLFDVETHDGVPYMVMELVEGETLRSKMGATSASTSSSSAASVTGGSSADSNTSGSVPTGEVRSNLPVRRALAGGGGCGDQDHVPGIPHDRA